MGMSGGSDVRPAKPIEVLRCPYLKRSDASDRGTHPSSHEHDNVSAAIAPLRCAR
jgi:hypothetical protein